MTNKFSRRVFLGGVLSGVASFASARAPETSLRPVPRPRDLHKRSVAGIEAIIARAGLGGTTGASVIDLKSGLVLEEHDATRGLPPASVTKSVTALYALSVLGADYRFETRLIATGPVSGGVIQGDLVLAGGGDPTLDTNTLANMARQLKAAGVSGVSGQLILAGGALPAIDRIDKAQPDHVGYNPAISGLNLNFNRVHFEWRRSGNGYGVTMDARSDRYRPDVRVAQMKIAARDLPVYTYRDGGTRDQWTVARTALGNGGARWLPVRKPALYAGEVFSVFARSHGITFKGMTQKDRVPGGTVLVRHQSVALRTILRDMLKYSNNMTAEVVGLTASLARRGHVGTLRASGSEMSDWARTGLGMQGAKFVDHSGLGDASRVSARAMAEAMAAAGRHRVLRPILKDIAIRDGNGRVIKGHPIKVQAKTGTLNFVSALAGYMTAPDGTEMAFAIFSADTARRARIPKAERERPRGAGTWNKQAKGLQQALIQRWGVIYGS